jgi:threonine/homoserine/homoserine lactone efflux protein
MVSGLTLGGIAALFGVMIVGASIPSASTLAVSARSAAFGFADGVLTSLGIVVGDIIFIAIAITGLEAIAGLMGSYFVLIKYVGGAYLIWLGVMLWRGIGTPVEAGRSGRPSRLSSFGIGLFITLGDQKAILFYLGLLPAFVDLPRISALDAGIVMAVAVLAVGGPKLAYAYMADRASLIIQGSRAMRVIGVVSGTVMICVGLFLVAKAYA